MDDGFDYELLVIGSGPAGQKAAIQAAKLRRRVAIVEKRRAVGGVSVNTGTIPSKTIREAILYLTGLSQRGVYGQGYRLKDEVSIEDISLRTRQVVERERSVIRDQLLRNHVAVLEGAARFVDQHALAITDREGRERRVTAERVVIAVGSEPDHPADVQFNGGTILDSDDIVLRLREIPNTLLVVGAGVIGIEFASMFAALGTRVTVVDARGELLDFCDHDIVEALRYHLRDLHVVFRFGERVTAVREDPLGTLTSLASGKQIPADVVFYSAGRRGATDDLGLAEAGLGADERGRIAVDEHYRTALPHVYAVGDVIGFPSLASTSAEQGRLAACWMFGAEAKPMAPHFPVGIYAIPEVSMVGKTEEELTAQKIPYETGIARYNEISRGPIVGDDAGMFKMLFHREDGRLLGCHCIGSGATELIHVGQAVLALGGGLDYFLTTVFNYPTLAECYKVAALDAMNKMTHIMRLHG
jgi:NAD(P) transhydrogenase